MTKDNIFSEEGGGGRAEGERLVEKQRKTLDFIKSSLILLSPLKL
jgi:hypothetical protein